MPLIAVDCGVMFPGPELLGVDLVIPDISYLVDQGKNLGAIVLTHAHEDHIGALPYVLQRCPVPVYGTRLTLGFVRHKLREHRLEESVDLVEIVPGERFTLGPFTIEGYIRNPQPGGLHRLGHRDAGGLHRAHRRFQDRQHPRGR